METGPTAVRFGQLPDDMEAAVKEIGDGRFVVNVRSASGGFLVLSETYYPGWTARIDGTPSPVRRADYSLQGVAVAPGPHTVVFESSSRGRHKLELF